jgi:hypothetical protein
LQQINAPNIKSKQVNNIFSSKSLNSFNDIYRLRDRRESYTEKVIKQELCSNKDDNKNTVYHLEDNPEKINNNFGESIKKNLANNQTNMNLNNINNNQNKIHNL